MTWPADLGAAAVSAVVAGGAAALLPARIAALPEPEPDPEPSAEELARRAERRRAAQARATARGRSYREPVPEPPKEAYATLGSRPGLGATLAALAAASGVAVGLSLGWDWALLVWVPLLPLAAALAYVDWHTRLLPVHLVYPAYAVAALTAVIAALAGGDLPALERAALGWVVGGLVYGVLWFVYPAGLGYGDVRLSGVLGIALGFLGWGQLVVGLYAGFLLGGVVGLVLRVTGLVPQRHIPFGPFMLLGALVGAAWGQQLGSAFYGG
jgi:leader peptidase (prepilin peptidase) / N-methyltransferase